MKKIDLHKKVYEYPTESEYGFTDIEIQKLLSEFENVNLKKFNDAMMGNTCMMNERDEIVNYHCDVLTALCCGLEDRDIKLSEWD